jgi:hypothetical protein
MKKIIYLILIVFNAFSLKSGAQSFSLINPINNIQGDTTTFQYEGSVDVINTSGVTKYVKMTRAINDTAPGHESLFCWGINCYSSGTNTSTYQDTLDDSSTGDFAHARADLNTWNIPGLSKVTYCWYDINNTSDSICLEFDYLILPTGIHEVYKSTSDFISLPYPNPADAATSIAYYLNKQYTDSKIVFYNVIGSKVYEVNLDYLKQSIQINTSSFQPGVYFYSLLSGGKSISTNKLIVSHKN